MTPAAAASEVALPAKRGKPEPKGKAAPKKRGGRKSASAKVDPEPEKTQAKEKRTLRADSYYRVNYTTFNKELKGELINTLVANRLNTECGLICEVLYKLGHERSHPESEILGALPARPRISKTQLQKWLELLN
jgi:hypothetical protein